MVDATVTPMTRRMGTRRRLQHLAGGAAGVTLLLVGTACSSYGPGVAGVSCSPGSGGSTGYRAPSLMTTGGGTKSFADLKPAMPDSDGMETSALGSGSDPCARIGSKADGGVDGAPESGSF